MSYETRVDDMIGKHAAHFQNEMTLAKLMSQYKKKPQAMPYGYPMGVYHPMHACRSPEVTRFVARTGGRLSNGVPKVIGMEMVDQYILGLYNPKHTHNTPQACKTKDLSSALTCRVECAFSSTSFFLALLERFLASWHSWRLGGSISQIQVCRYWRKPGIRTSNNGSPGFINASSRAAARRCH